MKSRKIGHSNQLCEWKDIREDLNHNFSSIDGTVLWDVRKSLTLRPELSPIARNGKPTLVYRGCNSGFSLPVWSTPANEEEQLTFRMRIPNRWDGISNPQVGVLITLASNEDVGDKIKLQLDWQTTGTGVVMSDTVSTRVSTQTILEGRDAAHNVYFMFFDLNANDSDNPIRPAHMLQGRLRNIDSVVPNISGEVVVWDWAVMWAVDKMYGKLNIENNG